MLLIDMDQPCARRVFDLPGSAAPFFENARGLPMSGLRGCSSQRLRICDFKRDDIRLDMESHQMIPRWETESAESRSFSNGGNR